MDHHLPHTIHRMQRNHPKQKRPNIRSSWLQCKSNSIQRVLVRACVYSVLDRSLFRFALIDIYICCGVCCAEARVAAVLEAARTEHDSIVNSKRAAEEEYRKQLIEMQQKLESERRANEQLLREAQERSNAAAAAAAATATPAPPAQITLFVESTDGSAPIALGQIQADVPALSDLRTLIVDEVCLLHRLCVPILRSVSFWH